MMMRSALYQPSETTVHGYTCLPTLTHYHDSEPTSLCSFSIILRAQRRSNKYQIYSLLFDPTAGLEPTIYHTRSEQANYYTKVNAEAQTDNRNTQKDETTQTDQQNSHDQDQHKPPRVMQKRERFTQSRSTITGSCGTLALMVLGQFSDICGP